MSPKDLLISLKVYSPSCEHSAMVMTELSGSKTSKINAESQPTIMVIRPQTQERLNTETEGLFCSKLLSICTINTSCGKKVPNPTGFHLQSHKTKPNVQKIPT